VSGGPVAGPLPLGSRPLPERPTTRFAPAPTGFLHLGHVVNALYTWGVAAATRGTVILRIEDHDRQRCRPGYETALLDDLEWLGFRPGRPSIAELRSGPSDLRQSDRGDVYAVAVRRLQERGLIYPCDCTRSTFAVWARDHHRPWSGPGCPGDCSERHLEDRPDLGLRVRLGGGSETFDDLRLGPREAVAAAEGDLLVRDRHGNWTYHLCVVVDDARHDVDLVIRGEDLLDATARQLRLARLLGLDRTPVFLHHPLARKPGGAKLSKADGDTGVRDLRAAGWSRDRIIGEAATAVGLVAPGTTLRIRDVADLFTQD
jgi:glutamyl-Q tRNA(Asp) synthetase